MKKVCALFGVFGLIVGLLLIAHRSSYAGAFNTSNLNLTQAREIYALGLVEVMLGIGALVVAGISYRVYSRQF